MHPGCSNYFYNAPFSGFMCHLRMVHGLPNPCGGKFPLGSGQGCTCREVRFWVGLCMGGGGFLPGPWGIANNIYMKSSVPGV